MNGGVARAFCVGPGLLGIMGFACRNEEAEHGDDLVRLLVWWSLLVWTVDRLRAQAATGA